MNKVVVSYCKFSTVSYAHLSRIWYLSTTEQHYLLIYPSPLFFGGLLIASSSYVWKQFPTTRSVFLSSIVEICLPVIIFIDRYSVNSQGSGKSIPFKIFPDIQGHRITTRPKLLIHSSSHRFKRNKHALVLPHLQIRKTVT